jgi:hypothetical protein
VFTVASFFGLLIMLLADSAATLHSATIYSGYQMKMSDTDALPVP